MIDKVLATVIGVLLIVASVLAFYAQHLHSKVATVQDQLSNEIVAQGQAVADRDTALKNLADTQKQLKAAQDALAAAMAAHTADAHAAQQAQTVVRNEKAPVMQQAIPDSVWKALQ